MDIENVARDLFTTYTTPMGLPTSWEKGPGWAKKAYEELARRVAFQIEHPETRETFTAEGTYGIYADYLKHKYLLPKSPWIDYPQCVKDVWGAVADRANQWIDYNQN